MEELHKVIQERYQQESCSCSDLSCGSTLDLLQIREGERILDLGCGRGEDTLVAAEQVGRAGTAVGLDLTEAMILAARSNAATKGTTNVAFVLGDIESLPFADGSFDGVTSNCVINHARDKGRVYREINRVLRQGGRFVISDAVTKVPLPEQVQQDPEAWAQCYGGAVTEEEYFQQIKLAGFRSIEILTRREYLKNGFDFISLTIRAVK